MQNYRDDVLLPMKRNWKVIENRSEGDVRKEDPRVRESGKSARMRLNQCSKSEVGPLRRRSRTRYLPDRGKL